LQEGAYIALRIVTAKVAASEASTLTSRIVTAQCSRQRRRNVIRKVRVLASGVSVTYWTDKLYYMYKQKE